MSRVVSKIGLLVLGLVVLSQGVEVAEAGARGPASPVQEKKTLNRKEDPVIILGGKLKKNLGRDTAQMSLFSCIDGKVKPVPFQIDKIAPNGDWVLPSVPPELEGDLKKGKIKPERDTDDGYLDDNDQLVFMIWDSGDRISADYYPAGAVAVDEIKLVDPIDGGKSWVYLYSFEGNPPPLSDKQYLEYVWPEGRIVTPDAVMGFDPEMANSPNYLSFWGSGNVLDRMKLRLNITIMGIKFFLNESSFVSKMSFYKAGPVRIIRRIRTAIKLTKTFQSSSAAIENIYYDRIQIVPLRFDMPISLKFFRKIIQVKVRGGADYKDLRGWKIKFDTDPHWLTVDGKMDETEKNVYGEGSMTAIFWGPKGALLYRIVLDRKPDGSHQDSPIKVDKMVYVDDETAVEPPEYFPGQVPSFAYWMKGLEELGKGTLYLYVISYLIPNYKEGMEKDYLNILDKAVEVYVN